MVRRSGDFCPDRCDGLRRRTPSTGPFASGPGGSAEQMLGEPGEGFAIVHARLQPGRVFDAMRWLGQAA
jgi:alkylation response protein AidB-like acyl-CoA dehydrogenase